MSGCGCHRGVAFSLTSPSSSKTTDATDPAWNGYLLTVACPCGVVFERWVTPQEAGVELLLADLRAGRS